MKDSIEEPKINPDNFFLMRYIQIHRVNHPRLKMLVNGKKVDIEDFLSEDISKHKSYNITFELE